MTVFIVPFSFWAFGVLFLAVWKLSENSTLRTVCQTLTLVFAVGGVTSLIYGLVMGV